MAKRKPVVLSIDDDLALTKTLGFVLDRLGFSAKTVNKPEDFINECKKLKPDLCLIDLHLENASGFDLIKVARTFLNKEGAVLVVSGSKDLTSVIKALELGADDYITKPLDRTLLVNKLSQYVTTEELNEHKTQFHELSDSQTAARLNFDAEIEEIDEFGFKFKTAHLIPKGTVLKSTCEFFDSLNGSPMECLSTIATIELDLATKLYSTYAEFEDIDSTFIQSLRRWLA